MKHIISVLNATAVWNEGDEHIRVIGCLVCHQLDGYGYTAECSGIVSKEPVVFDCRTQGELTNVI